jgi:complement component 1 Q subcomponent-binding protein, mitochondrial
LSSPNIFTNMSSIRVLRSLSAASPRAVLSRSAARSRLVSLAQVSSTRTFSVSARSFGQGTADVSLSNKLSEELKYEKESVAELPQEPEFLQQFKAQGKWQIENTPLHDEVTLSRKFGNENISLTFSIVDIRGESDEAFDNESAAEEAEDGSQEEEVLNTYPIRVSLNITKSSTPGAVTVDMMCQEGQFVVDNIAFYQEGKLATDSTAEADWKRRGVYMGPQFDTLDVGLQEEFEKYLQERGINEDLAMFIPEFAEYKEQVEYVRWLEGVKTFVEA